LAILRSPPARPLDIVMDRPEMAIDSTADQFRHGHVLLEGGATEGLILVVAQGDDNTLHSDIRISPNRAVSHC
jgi:hypothetical protein